MSEQSKLPHTAATIWSGFIYQGLIALVHVLKLITEDKTGKADYALQLDSIDDFAILDGNNNIISIHQVKARKSVNFSVYQEAISTLKEKANNNRCNNAFFHVAQEIADKDTQDIETEYNPVKIYKYDGLLYCSLNDVDDLIDKTIKQYYQRNNPSDTWRLNADYLKKTRNYLNHIISKKVIQIHAIVHQGVSSDREAANKQTIKLNEFVEILDSDLNIRSCDDEYYFYLILGDFQRYYQEYCIEQDINDEATMKKLFNYKHVIEHLQKREMVKFVQNIMPHRLFKFESLKDYKDSFQQNEIKDAFFKILEELKEADYDETNYYFHWKGRDVKDYFPTSIVQGQGNANKICQRILENAKTDPTLMYENSNLITADIDVDSVYDSANRYSSVRKTNESDKNILNWKTISFVKLNNAKGVIND